MSKWKVGKGTCVVSKTPIKTLQGGDEIEYYGGYLVCESVIPENAILIAAVPAFLAACENLLAQVELDDNDPCPVCTGVHSGDHYSDCAWVEIKEVISMTKGMEDDKS